MSDLESAILGDNEVGFVDEKVSKIVLPSNLSKRRADPIFDSFASEMRYADAYAGKLKWSLDSISGIWVPSVNGYDERKDSEAQYEHLKQAIILFFRADVAYQNRDDSNKVPPDADHYFKVAMLRHKLTEHYDIVDKIAKDKNTKIPLVTSYLKPLEVRAFCHVALCAYDDVLTDSSLIGISRQTAECRSDILKKAIDYQQNRINENKLLKTQAKEKL